MNWRESKLFVYGYLPFRFVFWSLAWVSRVVLAGSLFMTWLYPSVAREVWKRTR